MSYSQDFWSILPEVLAHRVMRVGPMLSACTAVVRIHIMLTLCFLELLH